MIIISSSLCLLLFLCYFFISTRREALQRYEQQTQADVDIAASNIDYYMNNCISAARSVYANRELLLRVTASNNMFQTTSDRNEVFHYLQAISYAIPSACQIFLALPHQGISFLYMPVSLQNSFTTLSYSLEEAAKIPSLDNLYIRETHEMTNYGHIVAFHIPDRTSELVFSIWVPISNIPYDTEARAFVAIDMPISFINENYQILDKDSEAIYVVDANGFIISSNNTDCITRSIFDLGFPAEILETSAPLAINGQACVTAPLESSHFDWTIIKTTALSSIYDTTWRQTVVLMVVFVFLIVFLLIFNMLYISRYTRPLVQLTKYMQNLLRTKEWSSGGRLSDYINYTANDEIGSLVQMFETMVGSMQDFTVRQYALQLSYVDSTLKMLQAQINPHFIYNTIQCFATNALRSKDQEQYQLLSSFGKMLHYSMVLDPALVPLNSEIDYIRRYLSLQQMRFDTTPAIEYDISPEAAQIMIPKLSIQPLVENTITHGKLFRSEGGWMRIGAHVRDGLLLVEVADNGRAITQENAERIACLLAEAKLRLLAGSETPFATGLPALDAESGGGIGIQNVFIRLILFFSDCALTLRANERGGTTAAFSVPIRLNKLTLLTKNMEKSNESFDC